MSALNDRDLLMIWENTLDKSLIEKCLVLLAMAYPEYDPQQIASFSIGERDARLFQIREKMFGAIFKNEGHCPVCRQRIEWEVPVPELRLQQVGQHIGNEEMIIPYKEYELHVRLPNSEDFLYMMSMESQQNYDSTLARRCLLYSKPSDLEFKEMPAEVVEIISEKFAELDPQADITIQLSCPQCHHEWSSVFDIMVYLWTEIQERVRKIYQEVVMIARHFSWSENEILSLSPFRRQLYLRMIQT